MRSSASHASQTVILSVLAKDLVSGGCGQILRGVPLTMTVLALLMIVGGCHAPRAGKPLDPTLAASDPDAQVNFWHALTDESVTSNDQAFHGLLLYADGSKFPGLQGQNIDL